jgi:hypothetical protein
MTGRAIGRCGEVYNSLVAALIILTCWPTALLTLSFKLSFAATVAIVGLHGPLCRCLPSRWSDESQFISRWLVSPACVSIAAQLGTGPLIACHFQHLAPVSLPANLLVVPLLGVCVSLGLLTVLLGSVWIPAALPFAGANYLALTGLIRLAELFAHVPDVTTPRPTLLFLLCAALAVVLATHARQNQRARATLLMLVLSWANLTLWPDLLLPRRLEAVFLDVEQGDSVFLRLPDGGTMLVDAGMRSRRLDFGERVVVPYLRHHNVKRLDVVVASHPHADHIGGLVHMLEQVEVGHYVDSGQLYDTWTARRIPELLLQRGVVYYRVAAGDCLVGLGRCGWIRVTSYRGVRNRPGAVPARLEQRLCGLAIELWWQANSVYGRRGGRDGASFARLGTAVAGRCAESGASRLTDIVGPPVPRCCPSRGCHHLGGSFQQIRSPGGRSAAEITTAGHQDLLHGPLWSDIGGDRRGRNDAGRSGC